ncbi:hypothetical protein Tco_0521533, partial [Tanacetum coccineum]
RSSGIVVIEGLIRVSVVVQAENSAEAAIFEELGAAVFVPESLDTPNSGGGGGGGEGGDPGGVFGESCLLFFLVST